MMKRRIAIAGILLTVLAALCPHGMAAETLSAWLDPAEVVAGEPFQLVLKVSGNDLPSLIEQPEGMTLQGSSRRYSMVNGVTEVQIGYTFATDRTGKLTIPPLKVSMGGKEYATPPLQLTVRSAETLIPKTAQDGKPAPEPLARVQLARKRTTYYVGETVPLTVQVVCPLSDGVQYRLAYPELELGKAILADYRAVNRENPNFAEPSRRTIRQNGQPFEVWTFRSTFRMLEPGKMTPKIKVPLQQLVPERRRSRDDWGGFAAFFGENYRSVPRTLTLEIPELTFLPLPPAPADAVALGLVGDYAVQSHWSALTAEAGEALTLTLTVTGAIPEGFRPPELHWPSCRVYPAETEALARDRRAPAGLTLRYVVIPLEAAEQLPLTARFCWFDPEKKQYEIADASATLQVAPSRRNLSPVSAAPAPRGNGDVPAAAASAPRTTLLYLKSAPMGAVRRPWIRNVWGWIAGFVILGPLWFGIAQWREHRRKMLAADPERQRRGRAGKRYRAVCRAVESAADADLPAVAAEQAAPYVAARWGLAPGTTIRELADHARDPEFAAVLRDLGDAGYLPETLRGGVDRSAQRAALLKGLRKYTLLLLGIGGVLLTGTAAWAAETPENWRNAEQAFSNGDFARAGALYRQTSAAAEDPAFCYNLGCTAEALGDNALALYWFDRAGLLAPGDPAIQENRNVLHRRWFLPEVGRTESPQELLLALRDHFRPDAYLLGLAVLWCAAWILAAERKRLARAGVRFTAAGLLLAAALLLAALISQLRTTYRADQALVLKDHTELYTLPGRKTGKVIGRMAAATPVTILEKRAGFVRIATPEGEGWAERERIGELLGEPPSLAPATEKGGK